MFPFDNKSLIIENIRNRTRYYQVKQRKGHVSLVSEELLQNVIEVLILFGYREQNADYKNKHHLQGYEDEDETEPGDHEFALTIKFSLSPPHYFDPS